MSKYYGPKENERICNKGDVLFECDDFSKVIAPEQGVIYYLNADCTFEGANYKKGYYKYTGTKYEPFGEGGCGYGLPKTKEKITDYVWKMEYDHLDYIYAAENFEKGYSNKLAAPVCTAIYKNGLLGRNLDWTFGKDIEAVVRTPRTLAVCGGIKTLTQEKMIDGTADKGDLKLLPFLVRDGMNNSGLACCINVVPSTGNIASEPTLETKHTIDAVCLCRYIIDNFDNALEACQTIKQYVKVVFDPAWDYELHYFVADKDKCYCLEVVKDDDGISRVVYQEADVMTNFHINGVTFDDNNKVYTPETVVAEDKLPHRDQNVDEYGEGLERYNDMVDALPGIYDMGSMFSEGLDNVLYTKAYTTSRFYTDFVDKEKGLTVDSTTDALAVPQAEAKEYYDSFDDYEDPDEARREDGTLWHTTHSSVYDIENNVLRIKFNEDTSTVNVHTFTLPFNFNDCFTVIDGEVCAIFESED